MIVKKPKWVIRSRKSKRDTQCSSQKKKDNDVKSITQKTKDRAARTSLKTGGVGRSCSTCDNRRLSHET
jgi:hypothetical protein